MGLLDLCDDQNRADIPQCSTPSLDSPITDDHQWANGEIELVGMLTVYSDASTALRDLLHLDPSGHPSFTLLDTEFELAMVLRLFFQFVSRGELCNSDLDEYTISLTHFARFLVKWDCTVTRNHFLTWIRDEVRVPGKIRRIGPLTSFKMAAILGCPKTCAVVLDAPIGSAKSSFDPVPTIDYNVLDPSRWNIGHLVDVPVDYHWALQRAFYRHKFQYATTGYRRFPKTLGEWFLKCYQDAPQALATPFNKRL